MASIVSGNIFMEFLVYEGHILLQKGWHIMLTITSKYTILHEQIIYNQNANIVVEKYS